MFNYVSTTLFAQLAVTLRSVTASDYLTSTAYHAPRVYAVTGRSHWIAFCLYSMSFVQAAFGTATVIYYAIHPGMISLSDPFEADP